MKKSMLVLMKRIGVMLFLITSLVFGAKKYCDPSLGTGSNDGTTTANAWQSTQTAVDSAVAGDTVYCLGQTEVLSTPVDFDTQTGSNNAGKITFIGTNASWVDVDSTTFVLDANGEASSCVSSFTTAGFYRFKNIRFTGAVGDNINIAGGADDIEFINCVIDSAGDDGVYGNSSPTGTIFNQCTFLGNTGDAIEALGYYSRIIMCAFIKNGQMCYNETYVDGQTFIGNYSTLNGGTTSFAMDAKGVFMFNVCDSAAAGVSETGLSILTSGASNYIAHNRFVNLSVGINLSSRDVGELLNNTFVSCGTDITNTTLYFAITKGGSETNNFGATDVNGGLVDGPNQDYNLVEGATGRRTPYKVGAQW
jgi:hypothetical protein